MPSTRVGPLPAVRSATAGDIPALLGLMKALAEYEGYAADFRITEAVLRRQGFAGGSPDFHALVAGADGEAICGMLVYYLIPFTFRAAPTLFIKELYVVESARGRGVGEALMRAVAARAADAGCAMIKWQVARWNTHALRLYERLGAARDETWLDCILDRDAISRLANGEPIPRSATASPATDPQPLEAARIEVLGEKRQDVIDALVEGVRQFNTEQVGPGASEPLTAVASDGAGLMGGVSGRTVYRHFLIDVVWIREDCRRRGLGRRLMQAAEAEAHRRGCVAAQVDTLSFQGLQFYQRLGFAVVGSVPEFPAGHARHYLHKIYQEAWSAAEVQ